MPLTVVSKRITAEELGISHLSDLLGSASNVFIKDNQGLIGWGQALKLTAIGPDRITNLDSQWREVVAEAEVSDSAHLQGSGLVAFGSISFAKESKTQSVLVIPQLVIGCVENQFFISYINIDENQAMKLIQRDAVQEALSFTAGNISPAQFQSKVEKTIELITNGEVSKVVLARDLKAKATNFNPNPGLLKLSKKYATCYSYLVDNTFGASPELLVSVQFGAVTARVLAGTAGRGTDVEVDKAIGEALAHSHKNLVEHKYAIDSLINALGDLCIDIEASSEPFSFSLPNLWHLASDVSAKLKSNTTSLQLLEALHPSAAVAGTPR
ncbi:MAG: isochorismate synthase, partial [Actinobacteria bacterium]|nr:isochorismate synthase [Actinomycetota bacterium]